MVAMDFKRKLKFSSQAEPIVNLSKIDTNLPFILILLQNWRYLIEQNKLDMVLNQMKELEEQIGLMIDPAYYL